MKGVKFETAYKSRITAEVSGINVNYISFDDLIKTKKSAGRPQDLVDIDNLKRKKKS